MTQRSDEACIANLVAQFDDAVNRQDVSLFSTLWTADAVWRIEPPREMHVEGRDAIIERWQALLGNMVWMFRGSFMGVVDVDGDTAMGRWPCIETGTPRNAENGLGYDNRAIYQDEYRCENGVWRFSRRAYHYLWLSDDALPGSKVELDDDIRPANTRQENGE